MSAPFENVRIGFIQFGFPHYCLISQGRYKVSDQRAEELHLPPGLNEHMSDRPVGLLSEFEALF